MAFVPNDYEYRRLVDGLADDGRRQWALEEYIDLMEGKGVAFRVTTTQVGDTSGESYWDGNDFIGGVVLADGEEIHVEAETAEALAQELKTAGFSDPDVTQIVFRAKSMSVNLLRPPK
jgi:hypothetical protein